MPKPRNAVSAYIVCKNEVGFLGDCLESLKSVSEIVVVDSGSTDGTLDVVAEFQARGFPIRLIERDWPGFARQKQFALDQCRGPWCLNLDADERLDAELAAAIGGLTFADPAIAGYRLRMAQYLPGYGYTPPVVHVKPQIRLVNKTRARYDLDALVHEGLIVDERVAWLTPGRVLHFRDLSLTLDAAKANAYSTLKARAQLAKGRRAGVLSMVFKPLGRFLKSYLLQRYIVCGRPGFVYSAMLGLYVFLTEAKLYRLRGGKDVPAE